jgi:flagellar assembly factor FliW
MQIESTRWGTIEVPDDAIIHFPRGLYGLEAAHDFCLLQHEVVAEGTGVSMGDFDEGDPEPGSILPKPCFYWLQAADAPAIAMIVTNPLLHFPDYEVRVQDAAAELLQASSAADVAVYTSVTVGPDPGRVYTNLLGPLVIHHAARRGMQLILDGSRYRTRHEIGESSVQAFRRSEPVTRALERLNA